MEKMEPQTMRNLRGRRKSNLESAGEILRRWEALLAAMPDAPAVFEAGGAAWRTFRELDAEAGALAGRLAGIGRGAVVALQAPNSASWIAALLGIWRAGGVVLLEDAGLAPAARAAAERICGARFRVAGGGPRVEIEALDNAPAGFGGHAPDLIKLTSGTSGDPRAVLFSAPQLLADCGQICSTMGLEPRDRNYGLVAFSHSYGFSNLVTPLIARGIPLIAARDPLPRAILGGVAATGATVLPAVPAIFQALSELEGPAPSLRLCLSAGAPLRAGTAAAFHRRFGLKIHSFYGASECGGICYDRGDALHELDGFAGTPLDGVTLEFLGDPRTGATVRVRSAAAGLGYFPECPGDALGDGCFQPADLLAGDPGAGFRIAGRTTDLINVGGRKVNPAEIERVLLAHPDVREAVVFGVADGARTEAIHALVACRADLDLRLLRVHCRDRLAAWQMPREITRVPAIPADARGKISRKALAGPRARSA
jgi:long-chain acyl-CoA synthetase